MNVEELRDYCLSLNGTTESFPFDDVTLVFKVGGKMYALVSLDGDLAVNLKCDPEVALELRELYPAVKPGYHMHKKYWNTVEIDGSIPDSTIQQWISNSYNIVKSSLPKKMRDLLNNT